MDSRIRWIYSNIFLAKCIYMYSLCRRFRNWYTYNYENAYCSLSYLFSF
jgi:hypothetical protein